MDETPATPEQPASDGWRDDLRKLAAADAQTRLALTRAVWELALARRRMQCQPVRQLLAADAGHTQRP
jgi:hypothetical protein